MVSHQAGAEGSRTIFRALLWAHVLPLEWCWLRGGWNENKLAQRTGLWMFSLACPLSPCPLLKLSFSPTLCCPGSSPALT